MQERQSGGIFCQRVFPNYPESKNKRQSRKSVPKLSQIVNKYIFARLQAGLERFVSNQQKRRIMIKRIFRGRWENFKFITMSVEFAQDDF